MDRYDVTEIPALRAAAAALRTKAAARGIRPAVVALSGDLGAGKTTFVQELARELGVTEVVTSPTFIIMKRYETTDTDFSVLIHIDAYRLEESTELAVLGFTDILKETGALVCIEWPERVAALVPTEAIRLAFTQTKDTRTLTMTYGDET